MDKEKKEIRLIELLNEYEKNNKTDLWTHWYEWCLYENNLALRSAWVFQIWTFIIILLISKEYGFIQRLVDNDKIDLENQAMQYAKSDLSKFFTEWKDKNWMSDDYAMLLMLLSIQNEPIEFLCSILK